jgi:hypothetical protein
MTRLLTIIMALTFTGLHTAAAQTLTRAVDADSIEVAAARYERTQLPASLRIVFEARTRTADGWAATRTAKQGSRLAAILGARLGTLGCETAPPCTRMNGDLGIAIQPPKIHGDSAEVTIEIHMNGPGSETYGLVKEGKSWHVTGLISRSAS